MSMVKAAERGACCPCVSLPFWDDTAPVLSVGAVCKYKSQLCYLVGWPGDMGIAFLWYSKNQQTEKETQD
jgi:hypothetical protein